MMWERSCRPDRALLAIVPLLLAVGLLLLDVAPAEAATIVVNSSGEDVVQNGQCTLLEALNNVNNQALMHPDCVPSPGFETIDRVELRISPGNDPNFGCDATTRVCTIQISGTYLLTHRVTIDGYTQVQSRPNSLAVGSDALIKIRLLPKAGSSVGTGLLVRANDVTIRGLAIGGFSGYGIDVEQGARARIAGCFIGLDPDGTTARSNSLGGIRVVGSAPNAVIGGTSPADRNVISGNSQRSDSAGILLLGGIESTVQGNYIGVKPNGLEPLPNVYGIMTNGVGGHIIGGTTPAERNVISGNLVFGVFFFDGIGAFLWGNYIGPRADGAITGTSNGTGVYIDGSGNRIGGTEPGQGNVIAGNTRNVRVAGGTENSILGNSIFGAAELGIDLGSDGVTQNDDGDSDTGPNDLQNFPVLFDAGVRANTTVHGGLRSTPGQTFRIELFSNVACDSSGNGEGETLLGAVNTTTNGNGIALFVATFPPVPAGRFITATATRLVQPGRMETSEFSACRQAVQAAILVSPTSGLQTTELNEGTPFDTKVDVSVPTPPTANITIPLTISDPTEGAIVGSASLTFIAGQVSINSVLLRGVDDGIDDGNVPYIVTLGPATSADPNYNGINPDDVAVTNVDNDAFAAQCNPRPKVNVSVVKIAPGQLRATVSVTTNPGTQNEIQAITWTRFDTATVVIDGLGPVQVGQQTSFGPLTQAVSFVITRTPGAQSGTVRLTLTDACGAWPTFVGGGPNAW